MPSSRGPGRRGVVPVLVAVNLAALIILVVVLLEPVGGRSTAPVRLASVGQTAATSAPSLGSPLPTPAAQPTPQGSASDVVTDTTAAVGGGLSRFYAPGYATSSSSCAPGAPTACATTASGPQLPWWVGGGRRPGGTVNVTKIPLSPG